MVNFHEHKLWQESYVALMDVHTALDEVEITNRDGDVIKELVESAQMVAATVADSLTRQDRRIAQELMRTAVGQVAMTRTHLAVAWGRGLVDDGTFEALDAKYAELSSSLQSSR